MWLILLVLGVKFIFWVSAAQTLLAEQHNLVQQQERLKTESNGIFDNCKISNEDLLTFPWFANLKIPDKEGSEIWPAVIINHSVLLTGSKAQRNGRAFRMPNGKLRILPSDAYSLTLKNSPGHSLEISYIKPHPKVLKLGYSLNTFINGVEWMKIENDIILIQLKFPIQFNQTIRPLCLPSPSSESSPKTQTSFALHNNDNDIDFDFGVGLRCIHNKVVTSTIAGFKLKEKSFNVCRDIWNNSQSSDNIVEYKNRICAHPVVWNYDNNRTNDVCWDKADDGCPLWCPSKPYFYIQTNSKTKQRVLVGIFNGNLLQIPIQLSVYISLITPSISTWIHQNINQCSSNNYTCDNGKCIPLHLVCNQVNDCLDNSDENPTYCRSLNYCSGNKFECGTYGVCLNEGLDVGICDGKFDCPNGEDEEDCTNTWIQANWLYVTVGSIIIICVGLGITGFLIRKSIKNRLKRQLFLSDVEILEFRQGISFSINKRQSSRSTFDSINDTESADLDGEDDVQLRSLQMPYIYDIPKDDFKFGQIIGSGAFGDVYDGFVNKNFVAIKVLKKSCIGKELFKTFLSELKILAYVNFIKGGHENIIKLIGAYTENIRNLELFIALEFCQFGSISDYLKNNKHRFEEEIKIMDVNKLSYEKSVIAKGYVQAASLQSHFGLDELNKWALQIVSGMCFLAAHKILHGDLATRNILLDKDENVKISDFGLSKQVYYYNLSSSAVVNNNTHLPWRWLAPEVIHNLKMSTMSDVWSFGVTMWELYSLGAIPYGGLDWNPNFIEQLKVGLRLAKPTYADDDLFVIIQDCWKYNASARCDFKTLSCRLKDKFDISC